VRLSVITDEISQDLDYALEVCRDLGVRTVELRAIGGANVVSHQTSSLQRVKTTLADKNFDVCAISSPFLKCHLHGNGTPQGAMHFASPASREEQWDVLERALNVARLLGAPVVRAFSFWRVPDPASVREEVVRARKKRASSSGWKTSTSATSGPGPRRAGCSIASLPLHSAWSGTPATKR
jgi:L-ribulose-5-phosphate 3-epimerase